MGAILRTGLDMKDLQPREKHSTACLQNLSKESVPKLNKFISLSIYHHSSALEITV